MPMVCPKCSSSYEQAQECPSCGVRLVYQATRSSALLPNLPGQSWQESPWGRIFLGVLLAQGLYYSLWHLTVALQKVQGETTSLPQLLFQQSIQALGLFAGGALAGAAQRRAILNGAVVGVWNVMLFFVYRLVDKSLIKDPSALVALYTLPFLHVACGTIGGLIGRTIWPPLPSSLDQPKTPTPSSAAFTISAPAPVEDDTPTFFVTAAFAGSVDWVRILAATIVTVAAVFWASLILDHVLRIMEVHAGFLLSIQQTQLLTGEVYVFALVICSAAAGANHANGAKHGMCVGILVGLGLFTLHFMGLHREQPAHVLVFGLLGLLPSHRTASEAIVYTMIGSTILGIMGGLFGSLLLPPPSDKPPPEKIR
jgi:hypothetical protein